MSFPPCQLRRRSKYLKPSKANSSVVQPQNIAQVILRTHLIKINLIFICYAEVLLPYAEAGTEMNQIDGSVINAINKAREAGFKYACNKYLHFILSLLLQITHSR